MSIHKLQSKIKRHRAIIRCLVVVVIIISIILAILFFGWFIHQGNRNLYPGVATSYVLDTVDVVGLRSFPFVGTAFLYAVFSAIGFGIVVFAARFVICLRSGCNVVTSALQAFSPGIIEMTSQSS